MKVKIVFRPDTNNKQHIEHLDLSENYHVNGTHEKIEFESISESGTIKYSYNLWDIQKVEIDGRLYYELKK